VHNDFLNTLADWGLLGALLVAGAWGLFYSDVFRQLEVRAAKPE
jgi:hypothetical protein